MATNNLSQEDYDNLVRDAMNWRAASQADKLFDPDCICQGNWRAIMKESRPLIGQRFRDSHGNEWHFFGVVDGEDDYYYGMSSRPGHRVLLLSCVGDLAGHRFTLVAVGGYE